MESGFYVGMDTNKSVWLACRGWREKRAGVVRRNPKVTCRSLTIWRKKSSDFTIFVQGNKLIKGYVHPLSLQDGSADLSIGYFSFLTQGTKEVDVSFTDGIIHT